MGEVHDLWRLMTHATGNRCNVKLAKIREISARFPSFLTIEGDNRGKWRVITTNRPVVVGGL